MIIQAKEHKSNDVNTLFIYASLQVIALMGLILIAIIVEQYIFSESISFTEISPELMSHESNE